MSKQILDVSQQDLQAALISLDNVNTQLARVGINEGSAQLGVMKLISAVGHAGLPRKVRALEWIEYPPGNGRPYGSTTADAEPFGSLSVEWNEWKNEGAGRYYVLYINGEYLGPHSTLDAAQSAAVEWLKGQIDKAMDLLETEL